MSRPTARSHQLVACETCGQLSRLPEKAHGALYCPTCGGRVESRMERMVSRTWALVIAGFILYIPANLFPVMTISILGNPESDTIMSGVIELFQSGMWAIGLLVLCASVAVPLMKLVSLAYLLFSVQRGHRTRTRDRTRLYRIVELIGRWSMLDVFLVSILIAVVDLGQVATISPEIGAVFFASVVIVTMFAANTFDPRIIWDRAESP
ncbi:paraquat-inducible protein A [Cerasicoccus maritimus]|uniref:paraquat-inducible protein A n=1 Tax=Cerasicoccus maritimus TaxID=490089 RepID=UPI002852B85D|nr:paraquat-inducible protein A [Cerasicoccus maritimus]